MTPDSVDEVKNTLRRKVNIFRDALIKLSDPSDFGSGTSFVANKAIEEADEIKDETSEADIEWLLIAERELPATANTEFAHLWLHEHSRKVIAKLKQYMGLK